jgi:hypothetical protein
MSVKKTTCCTTSARRNPSSPEEVARVLPMSLYWPCPEPVRRDFGAADGCSAVARQTIKGALDSSVCRTDARS